jgi:hypothetical protein
MKYIGYESIFFTESLIYGKSGACKKGRYPAYRKIKIVIEKD